MSQARLAVLALMLTALATPSCDGLTKSSSLSKSELVARADAICARVHAEYHANGYTTPQSIASRASRIASHEQVGVNELRRLRPPASMANDWSTIVNSEQVVAADTAKLGRYAKENNLKAATSLFTAHRQVQQRALAVAKRDGFKECSRAS